MFIEKKNVIIPQNDYVFKRIFGHIGNEDITKDFISSIIGKKIKSINLDGNTILEKDIYNDKVGILDIKAILDSNILCDIEMQVLYNQNLEKRILYYWSKLYSKSINSGDDFINLKKTISILITNFEMESLKEIEKFHTEWQIREKDYRKTILTNALEIHIINLEKFKRMLENNTISPKDKRLAIWAKFILNPDMLEVSEMQSNLVKKAKNELERMTRSEYETYLVGLREKAIMDEKSFYSSGFCSGKKEGKIEIAKKLLKLGMSKKEVMKITDLTEEEVKKINIGQLILCST